MGKRKERRLAAKIGAGRRVKLDLFADDVDNDNNHPPPPPQPQTQGDGDLSSTKAEVGNDVDGKHDDPGLSKSPSSSGQKTQDPLSLLGQYSDEDVDEGSKDAPNESSIEDGDQQQNKETVSEATEEKGASGLEELSTEKDGDPELMRSSSSAHASRSTEADVMTSNTVSADEKCRDGETDSAEPVLEVPTIQSTEAKTNEDADSCWKMVLHEESNQYYYWNTLTGETSWEVPHTLSQGAGITSQPESLGNEMKGSIAEVTNVSEASFGNMLADLSAGHDVGYPNGVPQASMVYELGQQSSQSAVALSYDASSQENYSVQGPSNAGSYEVLGYGVAISEQDVSDLPSRLVNFGETLLERLKLLQGSQVSCDQQDRVSKYILEIEIRLSDLRSLLPHGLSLVPLWEHLERRLNQLESAIQSEIGIQNDTSNKRHLSSPEGSESELEDGEFKMNTDMIEASEDKVTECSGPPTLVNSEGSGRQEASDTYLTKRGSSKHGPQSVEDVDMDIDMEIEDPITAESQTVDTGSRLITQSDGQQSISVEGQLLDFGSEFIPPPPLDEEWIPPPPPDNEGIPPPPPDEPPESLCPPPPPPEPEPSQSIYSGQYKMPYPDPSVNYYENTSMPASVSGYYELPDGSQVAGHSFPVYYGAVSNAHTVTVPYTVDSAMYYGLQSGVMPVVHVDSSTGSTFQAASSHLNGEIVGVGTSEAPSLSHQSVNPPASAPAHVSSTSQVSSSATVSVKEYVAAPSFSVPSSATVNSTSVGVADSTANVSKTQPKTSRMKKPKVAVASSMRSNKKVSSLVNKWMAAKEELEEEEEEPETALEILEKKRRREIEEWRAQQIASGEARENANFQPLGGDWRARVKRRKAQKEVLPETSLETVDNGVKQPDLNDLSKELPSGWQAFWDDSSKQVYYGNSTTSETSWTKPTR